MTDECLKSYVASLALWLDVYLWAPGKCLDVLSSILRSNGVLKVFFQVVYFPYSYWNRLAVKFDVTLHPYIWLLVEKLFYHQNFLLVLLKRLDTF